MPALRFSGLSHFSPSLQSQWIFSQVTMTSPRMASSMALPESRADTLHHRSVAVTLVNASQHLVGGCLLQTLHPCSVAQAGCLRTCRSSPGSR